MGALVSPACNEINFINSERYIVQHEGPLRNSVTSEIVFVFFMLLAFEAWDGSMVCWAWRWQQHCGLWHSLPALLCLCPRNRRDAATAHYCSCIHVQPKGSGVSLGNALHTQQQCAQAAQTVPPQQRNLQIPAEHLHQLMAFHYVPIFR